MMRTVVKRLASPVMSSSVGRVITRPLNRGPIIIGYHGVAQEIGNPSIETLQVEAGLFEQQIQHLRRRYDVVSLDYLNESFEGGHRLEASQVVITFDDAYKNVARVAAPILKSLGLPFAVFICTHNIGTGDRFAGYLARVAFAHTDRERVEFPGIGRSFDIRSTQGRALAYGFIRDLLKTEPLSSVESIIEDLKAVLSEDQWEELNHRYSSEEPMSWDDVLQLHEGGAVIGSHCHNHALLHDKEAVSEIERQLRYSKELIEQKLGVCKYLVYPSGGKQDISPAAISAVGRAGYSLGITSIRAEIREDCDLRILPRLNVPRVPGMLELALSVRFLLNPGYYSWASRVRAKLPPLARSTG